MTDARDGWEFGIFCNSNDALQIELRMEVEIMSRSLAKIKYRTAKAVRRRDDRLFAAIGKDKHLSLHLTISQVIDECALAGT